MSNLFSRIKERLVEHRKVRKSYTQARTIHERLRKEFDKSAKPKITSKDKTTSMCDVAYFLCVKVLRSQQALLALAEKGLAEDMMIIQRSIYEALLTVKYLRAKPDELNKWIARDALEAQKITEIAQEL